MKAVIIIALSLGICHTINTPYLKGKLGEELNPAHLAGTISVVALEILAIVFTAISL